jgi:hypothetical protein
MAATFCVCCDDHLRSVQWARQEACHIQTMRAFLPTYTRHSCMSEKPQNHRPKQMRLLQSSHHHIHRQQKSQPKEPPLEKVCTCWRQSPYLSFCVGSLTRTTLWVMVRQQSSSSKL